MSKYNLLINQPLVDIYSQGFLPQRNQKNLFYQTTSSRSNLTNFDLSSENRRILNKTAAFSFHKINLSDFKYTIDTQKQISHWLKNLGWDFPISSVKTVFNNHLFNKLYIWQEGKSIIAYSLILEEQDFNHIAYVFYDPNYSKTNLPIRLVLQTIIDSQSAGKKYCYLGQFSQNTGYYKRNMPGFEYFVNNSWVKFS